MLPYVDKETDQVSSAISYLENRITGEELVENFNHAVRAGTRSGQFRHVKMAWTKQEGTRLGHKKAGRLAMDCEEDLVTPIIAENES
jgi:hypothetical protein